MSCSGMLYGRSGMLNFPTCFLLRSFVYLACLRSGMFYFPTCFVLRLVSLFFWPLYACHVLVCFVVAPACFLLRHVVFFVSFVLLASLRMSCFGTFCGRSGMFSFPTCCVLCVVCSSGLFTHVMHILWSLRHVLFSDMFSASPSLFKHVLFRHVLWSLRHVLWSLRHVLFSDMFSACLQKRTLSGPHFPRFWECNVVATSCSILYVHIPVMVLLEIHTDCQTSSEVAKECPESHEDPQGKGRRKNKHSVCIYIYGFP